MVQGWTISPCNTRLWVLCLSWTRLNHWMAYLITSKMLCTEGKSLQLPRCGFLARHHIYCGKIWLPVLQHVLSTSRCPFSSRLGRCLVVANGSRLAESYKPITLQLPITSTPPFLGWVANNSRSNIQNLKSRIQDPRFKIQDSRLRI